MFDSTITFIKENIVLFDIIFLFFVIYFSFQCFVKGFFLSLISFLKWILALVITIILVPNLETYITDYF
jgi:Colicin V production protein.